MKKKNNLLAAVIVRWILISALCLFVSWQYNNDAGFMSMHVEWISKGALIAFWVVQAIHILFFGVISAIILMSIKIDPK